MPNPLSHTVEDWESGIRARQAEGGVVGADALPHSALRAVLGNAYNKVKAQYCDGRHKVESSNGEKDATRELGERKKERDPEAARKSAS
jgi:hypothetical protein